MAQFKSENLKKIINYVDELKQKPIHYPSVFSSIKKMTLFFLLYLFLTGIVAIIIIFSFNKKQQIVTVPKVINMEFYNAYKLLHEKNFQVDLELKNMNNIPQGKVAFQSIEEGKKVKKGRMIKIIVSLGTSGLPETEVVETENLNSYIIKFKLPDKYEEGRVKILVSDNKTTDKIVYNELINKTNLIILPVKIYGNGIQKVYINDELYLEKDIE